MVDTDETSATVETSATSAHTGQDLAAALDAGRITIPGLHLEGTRPAVQLISQGESYAAWQVRTQGHTLLFRFPRRPPQEMPSTVTEEFSALFPVPSDLGTRGIAVDDTTDNALGRRYVVTTYVPGRVLDVTAWTADMLAVHTDQLARLHDATQDASESGEGLSIRYLAAELSADFDRWCITSPDVAATSSAAQLVEAVVSHLQRRQWAFEQVEEGVHIHGDAVATNVVFDEHGTARFIDWEWYRTGDVTQDLAYIGGQVHGGPWYVPMDSEQVEAQVWQYLRARSSAEVSPVAFDVLLARRQAWEVYERFVSSLHFERVHRLSAAGAQCGPWVATMRTTLARWLGIAGVTG